MRLNTKVTTAIAALLCTVALPSLSVAAPPSGHEMAARMGAGINLGNALDAPDGEGTWRPAAQEAEFDAFKAAGFKHVRVPVTWGNHMATTAPYTVDPVFLARVKEVASWGTSRGMVVVINAHHESWFKADPDGQAARFDALWTQIADAFKDVPDNLLTFEVLNESEAKTITDAQTDALNSRVLSIIRKTNPTRTVIIGAVGDNAGRLRNNQMAVPNDPYLICTFHTYDPWAFASGQVKTWGTQAERTAFLNTEPDFNKLSTWSKAHNCPLYVGEFGGTRKTTPAARLEWHRFVARESIKRNFTYAVWDDSGDMEIYDRQAKTWTPGMLKALGVK